ncbi:MAG TPA: DUF1800 domain-containing protein [Myxococcales bacterium]|nr:DUF1800 domain-containing protein [Myxococcales bacterium]
MARPVVLCALLLACSHAARKDVTPPLAAEAPEAAAQEAAAPGAPSLTGAEMIEHLLARTTFGARSEDREHAQSVGIAAFVEEQLHSERLDDTLLEQRLQRFDLLREGPDALVRQLVEQRQMRKRAAMLEEAPPPPDGGEPQETMRSGSLKRDAISQLAQAKLMRAVYSRRQLQEVMTDFWFNHFNVFAGKQEEAALLPDYEQKVIRAHALGSFPDLLVATAHSPAMLIYLDNWRSAVPRPRAKQNRGINENYARELLELHTLGVEGGYTQQDVVEVARCFTGWTVAEPRTNPHFVFRPGMHDFGAKVVLGRFIPPGRGEEDATQVLNILAAHPATARFIALKLARRFVSDEPPDALVDRIAVTYLRTAGDIRSMLRTIFESPEFWSRSALRAKVRSPLELVAASLRGLDAAVDDPQALAKAVARIGEPLYAAQAPTGYPDRAQTWLTSGALLARIDFGLQLANGQVPGTRLDLVPLKAATAEETVDKAAARLGATELSEKTRASILDELRRSPAPPDLVPARAVGLLLGAPELQRR